MRRSVSLVLASAFSFSLASAATISVARADVKIVTKVSTTGPGAGGFGGFRRGGDAAQAAPSPNQTYTTYFKGRKARTESGTAARSLFMTAMPTRSTRWTRKPKPTIRPTTRP
jgi:hypothetical protein